MHDSYLESIGSASQKPFSDKRQSVIIRDHLRRLLSQSYVFREKNPHHNAGQTGSSHVPPTIFLDTLWSSLQNVSGRYRVDFDVASEVRVVERQDSRVRVNKHCCNDPGIMILFAFRDILGDQALPLNEYGRCV